MDLRWIENQNMFPYFNMGLLKDIQDFAAGTRIVKLMFSKAYNVENIIAYLKEEESYADLLDLLERVPDSYHEFLIEDNSFHRLISTMGDDLKKCRYPLHLDSEGAV